MQKVIQDAIKNLKQMYETNISLQGDRQSDIAAIRDMKARRQKINLRRSVAIGGYILFLDIVSFFFMLSTETLTKQITILSVMVGALLLAYVIGASVIYEYDDEAFERPAIKRAASLTYVIFWTFYIFFVTNIPLVLGGSVKIMVLTVVLTFFFLTVPIFSWSESFVMVPIAVAVVAFYIRESGAELSPMDAIIFTVVVAFLVINSHIDHLERIEADYQSVKKEKEYFETKGRLEKIIDEVFDFAIEVNLNTGSCEVLRDNNAYDISSGRGLPSDRIFEELLLLAHPDDTVLCEKYLNPEYLKKRLTGDSSQLNFETRIKNRDGVYVWWTVMVMRERNNVSGSHLLFLAQDIEQRKRDENKLKIEAENDPLTKIYNKVTTKSLIEECIENNASSQHALMVIDIDNFKTINDTKGHAVGDQILLAFTEELSKNFRETDIIGRAGGDEFIVFMKNVQSVALVCDKLQRLTSSFKKYGLNHGFTGRLSTSIGVALYNKDGESYDELFKCADEALYEAKRNGKDQYKFSVSENAEPRGTKEAKESGKAGHGEEGLKSE